MLRSTKKNSDAKHTSVVIQPDEYAKRVACSFHSRDRYDSFSQLERTQSCHWLGFHDVWYTQGSVEHVLDEVVKGLKDIVCIDGTHIGMLRVQTTIDGATVTSQWPVSRLQKYFVCVNTDAASFTYDKYTFYDLFVYNHDEFRYYFNNTTQSSLKDCIHDIRQLVSTTLTTARNGVQLDAVGHAIVTRASNKIYDDVTNMVHNLHMIPHDAIAECINDVDTVIKTVINTLNE